MNLTRPQPSPRLQVLIGTIFTGSTLLTPLYLIYKKQFGFSQITLTLVFAVYVLGNLSALLVFGRVSDKIGRRVTALSANWSALSAR